MKKILFIIIALFAAIVTMAYLYFSRLNADQKNSESSLYAATVNSALIFSFENDKSILELLKSQGLLQQMTGEEKYAQLISLKTHVLSLPLLSKAIEHQPIFISLIPGKDKSIDFLYSTQLNPDADRSKLFSYLSNQQLKISREKELTKITLTDSSVFYLGSKENLLLLSSSSAAVSNALKANFTAKNEFVEYIKSNTTLTKNSLAQLYVNFSNMPGLLASAIAGNLTGELAVFNKQNAFAYLVYNFSKEKILFTGDTKVNDPGSYYQLFAKQESQKISINNILPNNTANYTIFTIGNYTEWKKSLNEWLTLRKEDKVLLEEINSINQKYRIDLEQIFPKYFKDQMITFQLSTTEKIGAINLTNGDKVGQLLLDLSSDYNDQIKIFKEPDLLYAYFGEPFKKFKRPYYVIIDNYLIFANNASTLESFLNAYASNRLFINDTAYSNAINQVPANAGISFFIDPKNSSGLFSKNIYLPYYRYLNAKNGLKGYTAFLYQLNPEGSKFQTHMLLSKATESLNADTLTIEIDSLTITK
ncbi:hypothetical protein [Pedobacter metabolipauper]|uniref:DUF3352 domain-containing protein n=1 Tax=Pedobacter metabolipauper TaxID=425513 RepID=A0A4R6SRW4_9SPHI|nr:hypothetical protein [Pedobacter metabolipauper]TDQ06455.1 hypothetical protein ATK78_4525 [Pedobacter metabolipauper]